MRSLFDQNTFYSVFLRDLRHARHEVIIESPFITNRRMTVMLPVLTRLRKHGLVVVVNTRNPYEHNGDYRFQALSAVAEMQTLGIEVLYTSGLHRKIAIIDRKVYYEGSLNILSFSDSCEIMRRVVNSVEAHKLLKFIGLEKYVGHI